MPASSLPESRSKEAMVLVLSGSERAVTHGQLENLLAHGIDQLKAHGISDGDKVVFYCENSPEFTSTMMGCWALNAMAALVDYRAERPKVLEITKKLGAKLLVTSNKLYTDFAAETKAFVDAGIAVLEVSEVGQKGDAQSEVDLQALKFDTPALAILTSGTTGNPKTSVHTLGSVVQNIIDLAGAVDLQPGMTALMPLPLSHIFGLSVFLVTQILGLKTVLTKLEPVGFVKAVHRHKPELIAALPQFYGALMAAPEGAINLKDSKLLLCGGAPLTVSLSDKFQEKFGKQLNNGYGSTECKIVALNQDGPPLSVGTPVGCKIDIVNEQDEILPAGRNGEVRITSSTLMEGYLNNDEENRKVLRDGRYYTGDIGRFEDGHLFITGRKGDVVIVGGVVVLCGEVEEALRNFNQVKDVAVTAVPNKSLGQIIKASVVLMDDKVGEKLKSTDPAEVIDAQRQLKNQFSEYCKENLSRYKRPMKWEFIGPHDNLPKTLAGKTDKKNMTN